MDGRAEGVQRLLRTAAPTCLGLVCVLLMTAPLRPLGGLAPVPVLPLIVVFFWTIRAPEQLPAPSVFLLGLAQDFLSGAPLGLWSAAYLSIQYVVLTQRSYFSGRALQVLWVGFAVAALVSFVIVWPLSSLVLSAQMNDRILLNPAPLLVDLAATVLVYPPVAAALSLLQSRFLREV